MKHMVSNCVRKVRTNRGYSQLTLAKKIGVSRQTIISLEKGNYTPSIALALKIAKILKYKVEDLFKL
ncbi:helix-turn-helix transcriptional regulator [Patescibacteria group bacterium]